MSVTYCCWMASTPWASTSLKNSPSPNLSLLVPSLDSEAPSESGVPLALLILLERKSERDAIDVRGAS